MKKKLRSKSVGPLRSAILGWFGIEGTDYVYEDGATSTSGVSVTERSILGLSAAMACTRLISESGGTLPLGMYERTPSGKRPAPQHPLHMLLHSVPNAGSTAAVFWESTIAAMLLRGKARIEKLMIGGKLVGLKFLAPARLSTSCSMTGTGAKVYRYTEENGRQREIPADRIWTINGFSLDGKNGISMIRYGAQVFGAAIAADEAANSTFKSGLLPRTWFKFPKVLTKDQRELAREAVTSLQQSLDVRKPAILEAGVETGTVGIDPADAQLLESRGFSVEEVCRWFRVPPFMVGHSEKSTSWGTGIEQQMIGFLTFTLGPLLKRIEQAIEKDLLSPAERQRYYAKFSVEGFLRTDSAARSAFYTAMVSNGILTRDEVRALEEREPMGGNAAVLTVQSAMTALDAIGQTTDSNTARAALRAFLGVDAPDTKEG